MFGWIEGWMSILTDYSNLTCFLLSLSISHFRNQIQFMYTTYQTVF